MADQSLMDKSLRSVFVGNIPYEATEERLKDIFSEVGPVLSFKLVYDRETGKQKGYGFCEYKDQETALSAMRNLNGYEIGGRTLRVDNACTEKSRMEMQSLLQGPVVENPYGEAVDADKAPEAISKVVASLPPEQLFELMRQMKQCVQNNPNEARTMLLQNPQLAYALLQAQVVMRIVDAETAARMLHKTNPAPTPIMPSEKPAPLPVPAPIQASVSQPSAVLPPATTAREEGWCAPVGVNSRPTPVPLSSAQPSITALHSSGDMDLRPLDPRLARIADQDLRVSATTTVVPSVVSQPAPRDTNESFPGEHFPRDPRVGPDRFPLRDHPERVDPRTGVAPMPVTAPRPMQSSGPANTPRPSLPANKGVTIGASDQEKAALIMQVLQLSDEQISMLPPEQRQSILVLKEQIAKTTQIRRKRNITMSKETSSKAYLIPQWIDGNPTLTTDGNIVPTMPSV